MKTIYPQKLKKGDEIRVIAPSRSLGIISPSVQKIAKNRLESLGLVVTFGKHVMERDILDSSAVRSRVSDFNEAMRDKKVKMVLAGLGGYNVNQLLGHLDFNLIKQNPKIILGFSDITAITNAIYAKTGLVTYDGPMFSSFGMELGFSYSQSYFEKCFFSGKPYFVEPAKNWSDDRWHKKQHKRNFIKNSGPWSIQTGVARGKILGGNLCTIGLLQGTPYWPILKDSILFIEDDDLAGQNTAKEFERNLQSLMHLPDFKFVRGIVFGRFQKKSQMTKEKIIYIIKSKSELRSIPIAANLDFGHTTPRFCFPVGGQVKLSVASKKIDLEIIRH